MSRKRYVNRLQVVRLRNKTHFELMTELKDLFSGVDQDTFKIKELVAVFLTLLLDEDEAVVQMRKYETTEEIALTDKGRDAISKLIEYIVKTCEQLLNQEMKDAAKRLKKVLDTYGKIERLPYDEETAAIHNLLQELDKRRADVALVRADVWIDDLRSYNDNFRSLMKMRYSEEAQRMQLKMKEVREQVDEAYFDIVTRLEAGANFDGPEAYKELFAEINARLTRYANIMAQEKGRRQSNNGTANDEDTGEDTNDE